MRTLRHTLHRHLSTSQNKHSDLACSSHVYTRMQQDFSRVNINVKMMIVVPWNKTAQVSGVVFLLPDGELRQSSLLELFLLRLVSSADLSWPGLLFCSVFWPLSATCFIRPENDAVSCSPAGQTSYIIRNRNVSVSQLGRSWCYTGQCQSTLALQSLSVSSGENLMKTRQVAALMFPLWMPVIVTSFSNLIDLTSSL